MGNEEIYPNVYLGLLQKGVELWHQHNTGSIPLLLPSNLWIEIQILCSIHSIEINIRLLLALKIFFANLLSLSQINVILQILELNSREFGHLYNGPYRGNCDGLSKQYFRID